MKAKGEYFCSEYGDFYKKKYFYLGFGQGVGNFLEGWSRPDAFWQVCQLQRSPKTQRLASAAQPLALAQPFAKGGGVREGLGACVCDDHFRQTGHLLVVS